MTVGEPDDDGWLRNGMQHVLAEIRHGQPLVLTVIAMEGGELVQLTVSSRAPGRVYRKTIQAEEIAGHDNGPHLG
jgi:hypothetical protein